MAQILDTTLREGEQTPGVCFPPHVKLAIGAGLDRLGVSVIEAGHPAVTPAIRQSVKELAAGKMRSRVGAHARSLREDVDAALRCGVDFLGVFYCVSDRRLRHHDTDLTKALEQVSGVIAYAREKNPELVIRYTPEDGVRSPWDNVLEAAAQAVRAGADVISVADTAGHMIPGTDRSLYDYVKRLRDALGSRGLEPRIAVHCHNDRGLALANTLDAYRAGADILDASVLGLGERAGLTDLGTLVTVLSQDFGHEGAWKLEELPGLYALVSRFSGMAVPANLPVTGEHVFTHCAGVHTQAALQNPLHYQSLDPAPLGRANHIALDHMSGMASLRYVLSTLGVPEMSPDELRGLLHEVKRIGQTGRMVDEEELLLLVDHHRHRRNQQELAS